LLGYSFQNVPVANQDFCGRERPLNSRSLGIRAVNHPLIALESNIAVQPSKEVG